MTNEVKIALFKVKLKALQCLQNGWSLNNVHREVILARFAGATDEQCREALNEARKDFKTGGEM